MNIKNTTEANQAVKKLAKLQFTSDKLQTELDVKIAVLKKQYADSLKPTNEQYAEIVEDLTEYVKSNESTFAQATKKTKTIKSEYGTWGLKTVRAAMQKDDLQKAIDFCSTDSKLKKLLSKKVVLDIPAAKRLLVDGTQIDGLSLSHVTGEQVLSLKLDTALIQAETMAADIVAQKVGA